MALFLLRRKVFGYDEHDAAVIRAANEQEAREIAEKKLVGGSRAWFDLSVTCEEITMTGSHSVILGSFAAG